MPTVKIEFDNERAAKHFISWLCGSGEQHYWDWMDCREDEEDGPITAVRFDYWNGTDDGANFAKDLRVTTECGRRRD